MVNEEQKVYFTPGDVVTIRQNIPYKPIMIVVRKESSIIKQGDGKDILKGIKCRWFTKDGLLQEAVFNTKDIELYDE